MSAEKSVMEEKSSTKSQWIIAMLANTTLLSYGLLAGWVSPMSRLLLSPTSPALLTPPQLSWVASVTCLAAMLSVPVFAYAADAYGRRAPIVAICAAQAIAWAVKLSATTATPLLVARAVFGVSAGGTFNVVPMYTKEISEDHIRGTLGCLGMLIQNIGILVMYAAGSYLDYYTVLWLCLPLPIATGLLMMTAPESPSYLVKKGRIEEATSAIARLRSLRRGNKLVQQEVEDLANEDLHFKSIPKITFCKIAKEPVWRKATILLIFLMTVQAFNGSFAIMSFASPILHASGVTFNPDLQTLSFPLVMIVGSFVSMTVDKFGRKIPFVGSLALSAVSLATLGGLLLARHQGGSTPAWLPSLAIATTMFSYSAGVLPVPYIVMTEMLNFQIRSRVIGVLVTYAWFIAFFQLKLYSLISDAFGMHTAFFVFAAMNVIGAIIGLVWLPETKGKTTKEIEQGFRRKN